jgi:hypothetical protein
VFTHALLQYVCPVGHAHMPPEHERPLLQTLPHVPQFDEFVIVLTQALLQKL